MLKNSFFKEEENAKIQIRKPEGFLPLKGSKDDRNKGKSKTKKNIEDWKL